MTITKSGELASFYTVNKAPIKHLRVYFSPKQVGSGDPSPENVREISGWDGLQIYKSKKNMVQVIGYGVRGTLREELNNNNGTTINSIAYNFPDTPLIVSQSQTPNTTTKQAFQNGFITIFVQNLIYNKSYDISFKITDIKSNPLNAELKDLALLVNGNKWYGRSQIINDTIIFKNIPWTRYSEDSNNAGYNSSYFEIRICGMSFTLSEFMVTPAKTNDGIFEPYSGNSNIIDWSSSIGTIYGGYVDLITGEVVQTFSVEEPNNNVFSFTSTYCYQWGHAKCNVDTYETFYEPISSHWKITKYDNKNFVKLNSNGAFCIGRDFFNAVGIEMTNEAIQAYIAQQKANGTPLQAGGPLITPITYQLTPQQLETFIGRNNIWSKADRVEIEYDLAESNDILYRRRNVLEQYPHIITPAANGLINFNTDIKAPLKQCKVYFNPIQEGNGDPSPDNVRPITGWTGLSLYHSEGNLYTPNPNNKGYISSSGVINVDTTSTYTDLIPVVVGDTYTFRCITASVNGNTNRRIHGYDSSGNWVKQLAVGTTATNIVEERKILATIPSGISYIRISFRNQDTNVRIAREDVYDISWGNEAGTVYGGYVDLIMGELVEEWVNFNLTSDLNWYQYNRSTSGTYFVIEHISLVPLYGPVQYNLLNAREKYSHGTVTNPWSDVGNHVWAYASGSSGIIRVGFSDDMNITSINDFKNWLDTQSNVSICYPLATPITHQLTPTQLKTLRGINNIWSNSNGNIELSYWTH